jgi:hypothetical protein
MGVEMTDGTEIPPRWACERAEEEKCRFHRTIPNPCNIDTWMRNPSSWPVYHAWAASIVRNEAAPRIEKAMTNG